jgi:predicted DNA-binding protein with PD1-like motif
MARLVSQRGGPFFLSGKMSKILFQLLCGLLLCAAVAAQERFPPSNLKVYALRLTPGQDLREELEKFARDNNLRAAFIMTAAGSVNQAALRLANKSEATVFTGKHEIVSLTGTLGADGAHLHAAFSDGTGRTVGGHLVVGCPVYTTAEIVIGEAVDLEFTRAQDAQTGYKELKITPRLRSQRRDAKTQRKNQSRFTSRLRVSTSPR